MKFLFTALFTLTLLMSSVLMVSAEIGVDTPDGGTSVNTPSSQTAKFPNPFGNTGNTNSLSGFVQFALEKIVLPIGAVVVVFFVIYSGYLFVTANGSEDKLEKAKHTFLGVVIGAAILLGSWTIASAIKGTLCEIAPSIPGLCN